jgi:hypothetical protein
MENELRQRVAAKIDSVPRCSYGLVWIIARARARDATGRRGATSSTTMGARIQSSLKGLEQRNTHVGHTGKD